MNKAPLPALGLFLFLSICNAEQWPGFRGHGDSYFPVANLPIHCSQQAIAWKAPLPGIGQSSPVRWDERIFSTSVEGKRKETLWVVCHNLANGKKLWDYSAPNGSPEEVTDYNSWAAPTPIVDQERVYALFEAGALFAFDHAGGLLWRRNLGSDFGPFEGNHGQGSSPILTQCGLVILLDHAGDSYLVCLDKASGDTIWKTARDSQSSWSTPVVHRTEEGKERIICSAGGSVSYYDAETGNLKWAFESITSNNVSSPTVTGRRLLVGSSRKNNTQLLRFSDTEVERVWRAKDATSSFGSPLVHRNRVYVVNKAGIVFCYEVRTGVLLFEHRLSTSTWASPLGCGDKIYFFAANGSTVVMQANDEAEVVAESTLELLERDRVYGYAIGQGHIVLRTRSELVCLSN